MKQFPVGIIGGGPSGLAAAIQLKRQGIDCLLFEKSAPGGLLKNANLVENSPGFPQGIKGPELVERILEQAHTNGVTIIPSEITRLSFADNQFAFETDEQTYHAKIALIASGTQPKKLPGLIIPSECQSQVHYEIYPLLKIFSQSMAIIGAGDAAFDYALNVAERGNRVTILNRRDKSVALELLQKRVATNEAITYLTNSSVSQVEPGQERPLALKLKVVDGETQIEVDHLLIAVGREPSDYFLADDLKNELNRLQEEHRLYIVGDVTAGIFRQTSIATGEAVKAAMMIERTLEGLS